jgi:hypothetical protein
MPAAVLYPFRSREVYEARRCSLGYICKKNNNNIPFKVVLDTRQYTIKTAILAQSDTNNTADTAAIANIIATATTSTSFSLAPAIIVADNALLSVGSNATPSVTPRSIHNHCLSRYNDISNNQTGAFTYNNQLFFMKF